MCDINCTVKNILIGTLINVFTTVKAIILIYLSHMTGHLHQPASNDLFRKHALKNILSQTNFWSLEC